MGASEKPKDQITDNGCNCFGCGVFQSYGLQGGWFCIHGLEGKKALTQPFFLLYNGVRESQGLDYHSAYIS
jgi:hypothetical protein